MNVKVQRFKLSERAKASQAASDSDSAWARSREQTKELHSRVLHDRGSRGAGAASIEGASIELKDTREFQQLIARSTELTVAFIKDVVRIQDTDDLNFNVNFVVLLVTSFAERTTDERVSGAKLIRQADLPSDMLINHFRIS